MQVIAFSLEYLFQGFGFISEETLKMYHIETTFHKILHILRAFNVLKRLRDRCVCMCVCVCVREGGGEIDYEHTILAAS